MPEPKDGVSKLRERMKKLNAGLKAKPKGKEALSANANEWMDLNAKIKKAK